MHFSIEARVPARRPRIQSRMSEALRLTAFGLENLRLEQAELPPLGPTDVHVRFRAASLNFRDLMITLGSYNPKMELPRILGSDAAGEVVAVGTAVTRFKPGDRVASLFFQNWADGEIQPDTGRSALGGVIDGVFATERILPADGLIAIPAHLSFEQAATLPCAALTAWNALAEVGRVSPGETVLVLGTGGVSVFALQIAKARGATVIITSSSDAKLERALALGADHAVNYNSTPDWDKAVRDLTGNRGVDHVVEVGGAGTLGKSIASARVGGHLYIIGVLSGVQEPLDVRPILAKSLDIRGIYVGSAAMFHRMNAFMTEHHLQPVVDQALPFAQAQQAFAHLQNGSHFGKIVLSL